VDSQSNLNQEAADLSEEEKELNAQLTAIQETGSTIFIPHGRVQTAAEEKADKDGEMEDSEGSDVDADMQDATLGSPRQVPTPPEAGPLLQPLVLMPAGLPGGADLGEWQDLDNEIEDLDADGDSEDEEEIEEEIEFGGVEDEDMEEDEEDEDQSFEDDEDSE